MANYGQHVSRKVTPQSEKIPGREKQMVPNSAGGFTFQVDKWKNLERFLILGSEGGTYYISEQKLTRDNAKNVEACIAEDAKRVVDTIVAISDAGRAPKNSPAVFALALAAKTAAQVEERQYALGALPKVCRIGTHLFEFAQAIQHIGGWGRGTVRAVGNWYLERDLKSLVYQLLKYQERAGWSHRDVLRQSHPKVEETDRRNLALRYAVGKWKPEQLLGPGDPLGQIWAFEQAKGLKGADDVKALVRLIETYNLPRECLPTESLKHRKVWEALLPRMPITALIRNLGKLSSLDMLDKLSDGEKLVVGKLTDSDVLRKGRVHPMNLLIALKTYANGRGVKGKLTWTVSQRIADALDQAFYASFKNVRATGKDFLFGIDVSGSMSGTMSNTPLRFCEGAGAMALVTANVEKNYGIVGFCHQLVELKITPRMRLDQVCEVIQKSNFGGTDCGKPITWAMEKKVGVDVFGIYTDNETWAGNIHPTQALQSYRQKMGRNAKEYVVGMAANPFTIADPNDAGQLDVVGFDASVPAVIADFASDGKVAEQVDGDGEDGSGGGGQAEGLED